MLGIFVDYLGNLAYKLVEHLLELVVVALTYEGHLLAHNLLRVGHDQRWGISYAKQVSFEIHFSVSVLINDFRDFTVKVLRLDNGSAVLNYRAEIGLSVLTLRRV